MTLKLQTLIQISLKSTLFQFSPAIYLVKDVLLNIVFLTFLSFQLSLCYYMCRKEEEA